MLRQSRPEDMEEIVEIWLLASLQAHDFVDASCWWQAQEELRTRYLDHARIWVFEERGDLLGFMALVDDYLAALFVRPDRQGRGGHALLQEARSRCAELHTGSSWRTSQRCVSTAATALKSGRCPIPHRSSSVPDALSSRLNLTSGAARLKTGLHPHLVSIPGRPRPALFSLSSRFP